MSTFPRFLTASLYIHETHILTFETGYKLNKNKQTVVTKQQFYHTKKLDSLHNVCKLNVVRHISREKNSYQIKKHTEPTDTAVSLTPWSTSLHRSARLHTSFQ